ncbi:MAG TPA: DUF2784 domain-containing protein [Thermoanaerobaculia bacterium]|nr:DUF2784 domain-containing protein [Thermoanaerobaculia bacterium]
MLYRVLADTVVLLHLGFVLWVIFGGFLVLSRPRLAWFHLPAAVWGIWVELGAESCPLTTLENWLRLRGDQAGYSGGFIAHYILPVIYPAGLARGGEIVLGTALVVGNLAIYGLAILRHRRRG